MPLIPIKKKVEIETLGDENKLTATERNAKKILPTEQILAANHSIDLIDRMIGEEFRDSEPDLMIDGVSKGLEDCQPARILAATQNLTVEERNKIVVAIYNRALIDFSKPEKLKDLCDLSTPLKYLDGVLRARKLNLIEPCTDLFDLCIKIEEARKDKKYM